MTKIAFFLYYKSCWTASLAVQNKIQNRLFAGQGHVTMSIIKIGGGTKWLPELMKSERDEISKISNFEIAVH